MTGPLVWCDIHPLGTPSIHLLQFRVKFHLGEVLYKLLHIKVYGRALYCISRCMNTYNIHTSTLVYTTVREAYIVVGHLYTLK